MKSSRQEYILAIIEKEDVETQDDLVLLLKSKGYNVTQATVSRDIKDLRLIKILSGSGGYKYAQVDKANAHKTPVLMRIFADSVISVEAAGNLVIIKTLSANANAAAEAIDNMCFAEILGTIAGDNTIFLAIREGSDIQEVVNKLKKMCK